MTRNERDRLAISFLSSILQEAQAALARSNTIDEWMDVLNPQASILMEAEKTIRSSTLHDPRSATAVISFLLENNLCPPLDSSISSVGESLARVPPTTGFNYDPSKDSPDEILTHLLNKCRPDPNPQKVLALIYCVHSKLRCALTPEQKRAFQALTTHEAKMAFSLALPPYHGYTMSLVVADEEGTLSVACTHLIASYSPTGDPLLHPGHVEAVPFIPLDKMIYSPFTVGEFMLPKPSVFLIPKESPCPTASSSP